jgi:hypothetical protein
MTKAEAVLEKIAVSPAYILRAGLGAIKKKPTFEKARNVEWRLRNLANDTQDPSLREGASILKGLRQIEEFYIAANKKAGQRKRFNFALKELFQKSKNAPKHNVKYDI